MYQYQYLFTYLLDWGSPNLLFTNIDSHDIMRIVCLKLKSLMPPLGSTYTKQRFCSYSTIVSACGTHN